jgi:hypothetical protein
MNYTEDARYFQFVVESAIETEKINGFVKSIVGLSESTASQKLWAVHEDVGDKIRSLWDKFIAFLNRVWAKFVEFTNKMIASDKAYLEKYKDIILNQKPQDVDLEMRDYSTGIHRMTSTSIPAFTSVQDKVPVDDADISFKGVLIPEYKDASKDFAGFAVAYFQGGEDKKSTNMTSLNMTDLYNFCHDFEKIKSSIEKDKNVLGTTFNAAQSAIQKAKTDAQQPPQQQTPTAGGGTTTPTAGAGEKGSSQDNPIGTPGPNKVAKMNANSKKWEYTGESYSLGNYMNSYFTEDDSHNSGMTIGKKPDPNAAGNTGATGGDTKASSNMQSVQTSTQPVKPDSNADLDTLTKKIGAYNTAASAVVTSKMTSAHVIYKDYMKLVRLHVGSYVGQEGDSQVANSGSNYKGALKIDNPQEVLNTISQIENSNDANEKSKLTADLNQRVIAQNPNFKGGVDAIKAAATAQTAKK